VQHGRHQDYFPGDKEEEGNGSQRFSYEIRLQRFNEIGNDFDERVLRRFHFGDFLCILFKSILILNINT
jgi:hypothetical protein